MKINAYVLEFYERGIGIFLEKRIDLSTEEIMALRPFSAKFYLATREKGLLKIKHNFFAPLYRELGFSELSDKIAAIAYENKIDLYNFVGERAPHLLVRINDLIDESHWGDAFLDYSKKVMRGSNFKLTNLSKLARINIFMEKIIPPPFINVSEFEIAFKIPLIVKRERIRQIDTKKLKKLKGKEIEKLRKVLEDEEANDKDTSPKIKIDLPVLTYDALNYELVYGMGRIDEKNFSFDFVANINTEGNEFLPPFKRRRRSFHSGTDEFLYLHYINGETFISQKIEKGFSPKDVILFNYDPLIYSLFQAEYMVIPDASHQDPFPEKPYIIFPWYLPVQKNNVKKIRANNLPHSSNGEIYFPEIKLTTRRKRIDEPILLTKMALEKV